MDIDLNHNDDIIAQHAVAIANNRGEDWKPFHKFVALMLVAIYKRLDKR